jgi:cytochrome c oxidase subunit IV
MRRHVTGFAVRKVGLIISVQIHMIFKRFT